MALWKWALRHSVEKLVEYAQSSDAQRHLAPFRGKLGEAILLAYAALFGGLRRPKSWHGAPLVARYHSE